MHGACDTKDLPILYYDVLPEAEVVQGSEKESLLSSVTLTTLR